jgi:hypothetical protein
MSNCRYEKERVLFLYEKIKDRSFEAHLDSCPDCTNFIKEARKIFLCYHEEKESAPEYIIEDIISRCKSIKRKISSAIPALAYATGLLFIFLIVIVTLTSEKISAPAVEKSIVEEIIDIDDLTREIIDETKVSLERFITLGEKGIFDQELKSLSNDIKVLEDIINKGS